MGPLPVENAGYPGFRILAVAGVDAKRIILQPGAGDYHSRTCGKVAKGNRIEVPSPSRSFAGKWYIFTAKLSHKVGVYSAVRHDSPTWQNRHTVPKLPARLNATGTPRFSKLSPDPIR